MFALTVSKEISIRRRIRQSPLELENCCCNGEGGNGACRKEGGVESVL